MSQDQAERRKYRRVESPCPIWLKDDGGRTVCGARVENISDGGAFLLASVDELPRFGAEMNVAFSVPRSTANTYMLEEFQCRAKVLRHQPLVDGQKAGVALQFSRPQDLMLEV